MKETLEERVSNFFVNNKNLTSLEIAEIGAKWQQENSYSEEEMLQALNIGFTSTDETWEECVEFAKEQFKKK